MDTLVLSTFGALCTTAFVVRHIVNRSDTSENNNEGQDKAVKAAEKKVESKETRFKRLQWKFFSAYFLALLGDWLQGPYVYQVRR